MEVRKIKKFTYIEFLKYQEYIENINYFKNVLKEDSTIYQYNKGIIFHKHDKIFRQVLEDKKEVVSFINKTLNLEHRKEELKEQDIEKYNENFITNSFQYAQTDIVYRKKGEDIFFLIEHQSTVDYSMPYRILMYSIEIMKSIIDEKQLKKKAYKLPMVYPIIIYTGNKKWNVERYIEARQQKIPGCEPVRFYEYNVVDIHEYSENELLEDKTFLSKIMLLEKATTSQEIIENLRKIIEKGLTEKNTIFVRRMIGYIFNKQIGEEESQKLLEELQIEKGEKNMLEELLKKGLEEEIKKLKKVEKRRAIEQGKKEGIEQGKKEGFEKGKREGIEEGKKEGIQIIQQELKRQWIIKMIKSEMKEQKILEITEISQEELEKIKNKMKEKAS